MLALVAPSIVFLALFFVAPLGFFLFRSVDNSEVPGLAAAHRGRPGAVERAGLPEEAAYRALAEDLAALSGSTALPLARPPAQPQPAGLPGPDHRHRQLAWTFSVAGSMREQLVVHRRALGRIHLLADHPARAARAHAVLPAHRARPAARRERATSSASPGDSAIFLGLLGRTLSISVVVTLLCVLLGFPVAATMAGSSPARANALLILVLVPVLDLAPRAEHRVGHPAPEPGRGEPGARRRSA